MERRWQVILERLGSRRLALALFFAVGAFGVYGSLVPPQRSAALALSWAGEGGAAAARLLGLADTYRSPAFVALLALLAANLLACSLPRFARARATSRRAAAWLDLLLHLSLVLVLAGGAAKALLGSILTANVRVGEAVAEGYDWRLEADVPLGFTAAVAERRTDYYPASVRVGVRDAASDAKIALLELAERKPVRVPGRDLSLELTGFADNPPRFRFTVHGGPGAGPLELGTDPERSGAVAQGPLRYALVAFRHEVKSVRGLVRVLEGGMPVVEGWLGSNERLEHRGTSLFLTAWGSDEAGRPFIGLQFVRDPGAPLFWAGCVLLAALLPAYLLIRRRNPGPPRSGE